jgi:hypothetical protein
VPRHNHIITLKVVVEWSSAGSYAAGSKEHGTVCVFQQKSALEDAIEIHAFGPLEVLPRM